MSCDDAKYLSELVETARAKQKMIDIALEELAEAVVRRDFELVEAFAAVLESYEAS